MQTRIGIRCDRLIEAGWLTAAVSAPLFFNSYAPRAFDAPKTVLIRCIAALMLIAWLGRLAGEQGGRRAEGQGGRGAEECSPAPLLPRPSAPLLRPALLVGTVFLLATLTSIAPRLSFWGSYQRLQGTYTTLSYIVIFLSTAWHLRSPEQVQRLITAILITSWPVCLFGLAQQFGLDPLVWMGEERPGIFSTLGHPLYLAAYLMMVIPLTAEQLLRSVKRDHTIRPTSRTTWVHIFALTILLGLQVVAFVFTQSRAPTLGLIAGCLAMFLVWAYRRGRRDVALTVLNGGVLAFLWLILINLPNTPFPGVRQTLAQLPYLGRISNIFETQSGSGGFRLVLWNSTAELMASDPARLALGFGPETYAITILPHYPQPLLSPTAERLPDRAHNETFDILATTGLLGLLAQLCLFGGVLYYGLRCLGLAHTPRQRTALIGLMGLTILAGVMLPRGLMGNWSLSGPGVSLGLVVGFFLFLAGRVLTSQRSPVTLPGPPAFLTAALAAIVAHLVEISFGIGIPTTRLYFWLFAGLIASAARSQTQVKYLADQPTESHPLNSQPALGILLAMVLVTIVFDLVDVFEINLSARHFTVLALLVITWAVGGLMVADRARPSRSNHSAWLKPSWHPWTIAGGLVFSFVLTMSFLTLTTRDATVALAYYIVWVFGLAVVLALILPGSRKTLTLSRPRWRILLNGLLTLAFVVTLWGNSRLILADVYLTLGTLEAKARHWDRSLEAFQRTLTLVPDESLYYQRLAQMYLDRANATANLDEKEVWLQKGSASIDRARTLNPLSIDQVYNSAQYYLFWAQVTRDPRQRLDRVDLALGYCRQASQMFPANPDIYTTCGLAYQVKGDYTRAFEEYQHALQLKPDLAPPYLYMGNAYQQGGKWGEAITAYQKALALNPNLIDARRGLAGVLLAQDDVESALEETRRIVELTPDDFAAHRDLALIYRQMGRLEEALTEATAAWNLAPTDQRSQLNSLIEELKKR